MEQRAEAHCHSASRCHTPEYYARHRCHGELRRTSGVRPCSLTLLDVAASFRLVEIEQNIFSQTANTPAAQALFRRLERGGGLCLENVHPAAHPFFAALLHQRFPQRPMLVVTAGVKAQEMFHQDLATWMRELDGAGRKTEKDSAGAQLPASTASPLFFPAWDILPHEPRLPHVDVISERLETLVALTEDAGSDPRISPVTVSTVVALMQRTFPPGAIAERTRVLQRGEHLNPLDLVEWLEDQGYEPEAQVNGKGEIALRGGILDIFPPTSPWPVRVEFFGDEIDSIREFDPRTQLSKEPIASVALPPAGELGILKRLVAGAMEQAKPTFSTLADYLPEGALLVLCEPDAVESAVDDYEKQVPSGDPFFLAWESLRNDLERRGVTTVELAEAIETAELPEIGAELVTEQDEASALPALQFQSLEAFRP